MKTQTLDHQALAEAARLFARQIECRFHDGFDLAVAIQTGGSRFADILLPGFREGFIKRREDVRPGNHTRKKKGGVISRILPWLPLWVLDALRKAELSRRRVLPCAWQVEDNLPSRGRVKPCSWQVGDNLPSRDRLVKRILVIDDAVDSGNTAKGVREYLHSQYPDAEIVLVALTVTRKAPVIAPDFTFFPTGTILRFPWSADFNPHRRYPRVECSHAFGGLGTTRPPGPTQNALPDTGRAGCPQPAMRKAIAIDLDGTLCRGNTFHLFVKWLILDAGWKPALLCLVPSRISLVSIILKRKFRLISHAEAKERIVFVATKADIDLNPFIDFLLSRLNSEVIGLAHKHSEQGDAIILATAAPALYARLLGERLNFDAVLATEQGKKECRGVEKRRRVEELCHAKGWHLTDAVSDHPDDTPLMTIPGVTPHWVK